LFDKQGGKKGNEWGGQGIIFLFKSFWYAEKLEPKGRSGKGGDLEGGKKKY